METIKEEVIKDFLKKVIEIEESPAFSKGGQDSARREKIQRALDELCK